MSRKEKVYPSGIHVKFQRAVRISPHTRFEKLFHKAPQYASTTWNMEKFCRKKGKRAILLSLFEEKFKTRNSRGSDEKVEQTWRLRNYEAERKCQSQCQRTPIFIKLRYLMMRWKIHASNNFPICFLWYKKRGFYLKIDNFASLSISIRIKIIRESIEKGVKKRKKILVVSSIEAGFENDRRKAAEAACQRRRGRRRSPRARKFRPERFVSLVTWRSLAKLYLTATDRLRNVSVWIRWREFATEKMDPRLEIFRNEIEEKGLRVYHVENGLTEWFNSVITRTRMK